MRPSAFAVLRLMTNAVGGGEATVIRKTLAAILAELHDALEIGQVIGLATFVDAEDSRFKHYSRRVTSCGRRA